MAKKPVAAQETGRSSYVSPEITLETLEPVPAAVLHIAGQRLEVVSEQLVHAHGKSAEGADIEFSYCAVTVRPIRDTLP